MTQDITTTRSPRRSTSIRGFRSAIGSPTLRPREGVKRIGLEGRYARLEPLDQADRGAVILLAAQTPSRGRPRDSEVPDRLPSTTGCAVPDTLRPYALDLS